MDVFLPASVATQAALSAIAGLLSHLILFIHGEWHEQAPALLRLYAGLAVIVYLVEANVFNHGFIGGIRPAAAVVGAYAGALFGSMIIYRTLFHRLRGFNGPFLARISKLYHVYKVVDSKNHEVLTRWYEKYGEFVRTGPNEVTIFHPEVLSAVDGLSSACVKSDWYDIIKPDVLLNTVRDKAVHDQRRRIWDHAFTGKALSSYKERIVQYALEAESQVRQAAASKQVVDAWKLLYEFSFDIMGDFAFGRTPEMARTEEWKTAVRNLKRGMALLGPFSPVPWLLKIGFSIPRLWIVRDFRDMVEWCKQCMRQRMKMTVDKPDIASWLIEASKADSKTIFSGNMDWIQGDSITMIVAGSDTVAPSLVFAFYHLARDPQHADKIRQELQTVESIYDTAALQKLKHLAAFTNEILRLYPPTPTGGYRISPPQGLTIAGRYIPGNTTIVAPKYHIARLESCFERANEFIPERWYSRPEMVKDRRAFSPFAQGRYSCLGKNLALAELHFMIALFASRYKIRFPEGDDGSRVVTEMKDCFTANPGPLKLVFEPLAGQE